MCECSDNSSDSIFFFFFFFFWLMLLDLLRVFATSVPMCLFLYALICL